MPYIVHVQDVDGLCRRLFKYIPGQPFTSWVTNLDFPASMFEDLNIHISIQFVAVFILSQPNLRNVNKYPIPIFLPT